MAMMFRESKDIEEFDISIVSDASGSWGCGAINSTNGFQLKWAWLGSSNEQNIMVKELLPIVIEVAVWGAG